MLGSVARPKESGATDVGGFDVVHIVQDPRQKRRRLELSHEAGKGRLNGLYRKSALVIGAFNRPRSRGYN